MTENENMDLILLPGNNSTNKEWIEKVGDWLKEDFETTKIQYYEHWRTGEEIIDLDKELEILKTTTKKSKDYVIFAKSAGVVLSLYGIYKKIINPSRCIFVGTPVFWARANGFLIDKWLLRYSIPTIFIQQTSDPSFTFEKLKKILEKSEAKNFEMLETPGDDHDYENIDQFKKIIKSFLNLHQR